MRTEPRVDPATVKGLIWPGDELAVFEERNVDTQKWYRVRITRAAANRAGAGLPVESEGWVSAGLVSPLTAP